MKLCNVDLRGRQNHRIEEHGDDKPQNEKQGLHITNGNSRTRFYHDALLCCQATHNASSFFSGAIVARLSNVLYQFPDR